MSDQFTSYQAHGYSMVAADAPTMQGLLVRIPTKPLTIPTASEAAHGNRP